MTPLENARTIGVIVTYQQCAACGLKIWLLDPAVKGESAIAAPRIDGPRRLPDIHYMHPDCYFATKGPDGFHYHGHQRGRAELKQEAMA